MKITEPIKVGKITLKNRIMFPPLTTGYEERDGSIGEHSRAFYTRLAKGGVGYIVIGDVVPVNTVSPTPKLFCDEQIGSFKALADSVHAYGAKLGLQLFHPEYDTEAIINFIKQGKRNEAFAKLHHDRLHFTDEVTPEKLASILEHIKACAHRAYEAGVDVIEVHGDRVVGSLCSTILNHRTDEYGGSFENRTRFALEFVKAIKEGAPDITIDYKLPIVTKRKDGTYQGKGGLVLEEAVKLAKLLEENGVDRIHVAQANHTGNRNDTIPARGTRAYGFRVEEAKAIKAAVSIPVSIVGRICTVKAAESLIEQNVCDIVAFGRNHLTDPDIANKIADGKDYLIRQCINCNKGCTDRIQKAQFLSCVLNAESGYEATRSITKAVNPRTVAVVGGGIAGLEAARVLALKGHKVDLYEKSYRLGGQINIAAVPPRKEERRRILNFYDRVLPTLDVKIHLGVEFTKERAKNYSDIIVAIGAHNLVPHIPGIDGENVVSAWDVLDNKEIVYGSVAVCGGGLVGAETAEYLADKGYDVTIVERMDKIAKEESNTILPIRQKDFADHNVKQLVKTKIVKMDIHGLTCDKLDDNGQAVETIEIPCDTIVNALASQKNKIDLEGVNANIVYVGDCGGERPSNIEHAIKSAYDAANSIN